MTGYESKRAAAQDKITDEQGRPMTYWGGKAQPAQEPVALHEAVISAWSLREVYFDEDGEPSMHRSPPQRTWVDLTDWEINSVANNNNPLNGIRDFARAIEAKLKEKNNGA